MKKCLKNNKTKRIQTKKKQVFAKYREKKKTKNKKSLLQCQITIKAPKQNKIKTKKYA